MNQLETHVSFQPATYAKTEQQVRAELAACYRLMALYGMTDLTDNHVTARVPGTGDHILINAYGMMFEEITASSLFKIDLNGAVITAPDLPYGINPVGAVIHSAIHAGRRDIQCVLHTHTRAGVAVSCMKDGLLPLNNIALQIIDDLGYHDYEGPVCHEDEKRRLVADLGTKNHLIMRNHGLLTVGRSIPEAFKYMYGLVSACKIQVDLMASRADLVWPSDLAVDNQATFGAKYSHIPRGDLEWPALLRKLERELPGYDQ